MSMSVRSSAAKQEKTADSEYNSGQKALAGAEGFEPSALGFGDRCSDQAELRPYRPKARLASSDGCFPRQRRRELIARRTLAHVRRWQLSAGADPRKGSMVATDVAPRRCSRPCRPCAGHMEEQGRPPRPRPLGDAPDIWR